MIRRYIRYGISAICLLLGWACQQEQLTEAAKGVLRISLTDAAWSVETKATPQELEDEVMGLFQIAVRNSAGYTLFEGDLTEPEVALPEGLYTVRAAYGTEQPLALDAPYYLGELSNVQIKAGKTTPITITCQVMNALLSIDWSNRAKFDQTYSDYGVQVKVGNASVTLRPDNTQSAYIQAGTPFSLTFVGTVRASQNQITTPLTDTKIPASLAAGDHCTLTLNIDSQTALQVQKADIDRTTIQESIPVEWLPAPTVTAQGFENNQLSFYETDAPVAQLNFDLSGKLQEMAFTLALDEESPYADLNGDYTLSTLTSEQKGRLIRAGFILPDINVQAGACLSLSDFVSNLLASNEGERTHQITLTHLKANGRDIEQPLTYTITVKKPEFSVSVDERNSWSREFTIDEVEVQAGNASRIKSNLVYQYFDGTAWMDCQTRDAMKGRTQQFTEAAEAIVNKSYRVRALYRGAITSAEATATLEEPTPIPNGDMEEWQQQSTKWDFPNYLPWNNGAEAWWNTDNEFTLRYTVPATSYNGFPAVSYSTEHKHSGARSAELRNTAAGPAGTGGIGEDGAGAVIYDANKVAGMLFVGDYTGTTSSTLADGSISIDEGRVFHSRPTKLSYWYMYEPYGTDTYDMAVKAFDADNNLIATSSYASSDAQTEWKQVTVNLDYTSTAKIAKIYVFFESSNAGHGNVPYGKKRKLTLADDKERTTHYGSVLRIDDIQLIYDK